MTAKTKSERKRIWRVLLGGIACGAIVWGLSVPLTGFREPWDSPSIYYIVAMFIAGIVAALPAPRYWWAAVVGVWMGGHIYAFVMLPETRLWLLFGMYMSLLTLTWLPPTVGALIVYIVNWWRSRRPREGA